MEVWYRQTQIYVRPSNIQGKRVENEDERNMQEKRRGKDEITLYNIFVICIHIQACLPPPPRSGVLSGERVAENAMRRYPGIIPTCFLLI